MRMSVVSKRMKAASEKPIRVGHLACERSVSQRLKAMKSAASEVSALMRSQPRGKSAASGGMSHPARITTAIKTTIAIEARCATASFFIREGSGSIVDKVGVILAISQGLKERMQKVG